MAEEYKIQLGIDLDTTGLKEEINRLDDKYKIKLGVDLKVNDIRDRITQYNKNTNNAKLKLGIKLDTDDLKQQINKLNLSGTSDSKGVAIPVNTTFLENSLREVKEIIESVRKSLGTLDDKSGMKSLISSVNQIATVLGKATDESNTLVKSLDILSKKEFGFNFNLKTGNANPIKAATDYGIEARRKAIPALQEQASYLQNLLGGYQQADRALERYLVKVYKANGVSIKNNLIDDMANTSSISKQMEAIEKYIDYLRKIATTKGIDLSDFDSQFSKSAEKIIDDTVKIQTGAKQTEESLEAVGKEMKQIFGGGISADGLFDTLKPIIEDLGEIKKAVKDLSENISLDGLTQSFNKLSETLEQLISNAELVQDVLGNSFANTSNINTGAIDKTEQASDDSTSAVIQSENQKQQAVKETADTYENVTRRINQSQKLISDSAQKSIDNVTSKGINRYFEVSSSDSNDFRSEMNDLVRQWTNGKGNLVDLKIDTRTSYSKEEEKNIERLHQAQVTYNNELGETIKKTIAWRQIGTETSVINGKEVTTPIRGFVEVSSQYSKSISKTKSQTDTFVKQQKTAVANLTNQINQLNRAANDQNAARPIKDSSHLDALRTKYDEITSAIQKMENASADTFVDEQNNVKTLISEYKSLVSEYKNAENVSSKMKGTDFESGLKIAKNDLEKFKADAKDFPQLAAKIKELDNAIANVGDSSSLNKFTDQLKIARSELAKVKSETSVTNRNEKVGINVSGLESKIADLKKISPEIDKFETEINGAKVTVQSLLDDLGKVKTQGDFSVVNAKWKEFTDAAKAAGIAVTETATKIEFVDGIKNKLKDTGFDGFGEEVRRAHVEVDRLGWSSTELQEALNRLDAAMEAVISADEVNDVKQLVAANKEYEEALKRLYSLLKKNQQAEKDAFNAERLKQTKESLSSDMEIWLKENTRAAKDFGEEVRRLQASLDGLDANGVKLVKQQFDNIRKTTKALGKDGLTVFDKLKAKAKEYMTYLSAAELFMYAEQALRSMFEQVKLIDSAMTELKKVTDETDASYNKFLTNAASRAKEIGTTIDGLVSSTADFARLGYEFADAQGLAEVANIYAVVGDDIDSVETATQSLISTLTAFKDEANGLSNSDFAMSIVDKMNEVSNNFAISSGGIGDALQRSASSMMAANNSLDETIALITAANTVVQDADSVGTAFKTISMRIRGAKTELEEAGLETDGMASSTAKLREEILALSGVDIMLNANEFKSTYQIMDELADKWQDLTDIQQASVTELIAGKRQGNIVSSLMNNFDIAEQALETSLNSAGSAMKEHEKWQQSLEAQILKLKASWQGLSQSFLSSDFLNVVLDIVINLIDGVTKLIDICGTIPTLLTTIATGMSLFKNQGIFKTLTSDLDGFINKIGVANKSFADLANAFKFGSTSSGLKGFFNGLSAMKNSLSDSLTKADIANIQAYNKEIESGTSAQTAWYRTMQTSSKSAQDLVSSANGSKVALNGMKAATIGSKVALIGAKVAAVAFNAALTMGISLLIDWAVSGIQKLINAKKDLAEKVDEVTSKYKEQHDSLMKLKGDYDISDADSMISKYEELSKGVNSLGENVSLTTDEYSEYQSIVDTIASQNPDLVAGYNSQGDAILTCAGNIDKLVESYQNLIREQNKKVLDTGEDIFKDFKNDLDNESKGISHGDVIGGLENLENILSSDDIESVVNNLSGSQAQQISKILEDYGIKRDVLGSGKKGYENWQEHIINAVNNSKAEVKSILDEASADINAYAEDLGTVTDAYFSDAFLGDYAHMSERMQNIITQATSGFDSEFYAQFLDDENPYESLTNYFESMLESLDNLSNTNAETFEAAFDLQTQFNGGEISYGEYVKNLQEAGKIIDGLDLDEEVKTQIKLSLGLNEEGLVEEYENLVERLSGTDDNNVRISDFEIDENAAKKFLDGLSAEELSVATQVIPELSENGVWETVEDLQKAINREMAVQGLTFDLNLEFETESIDTLNTALAESVSATGLSSESIATLKSRYADLESQGYDLSVMFEETSNGIHLNRKAVSELERTYAKQKQNDIKSDLEALQKEYKLLDKDIENCNDASERAALYVQRDAIAQQINDAATLAAQYEGLTSAYNAWLSAEEAGSERDMYENMISGFETVEDEIKRGWLDDGTIEFLKLLKGEKATIVDANGVSKEISIATASARELKQVWDGLDNTIKNTSYSVKDFFTVDEDGNSTSQGVYNFLDAVGQLEEEAFGGKDVVKRKDGKIIGFDFQIAGGDEAIAEALGISEELVQIMLRAADDAGFVVTLDGQYTQLADLKTSAETANDALKKLKSQGVDELKDADLNFDFSANNLQDLNTQLEKATTVLDKFRNKDGTINMKMDGAEEALEIASYFTATIDKLTEPVYMQLETNQVEEDLQEPLTQMQEFERLSKEKHQLKLTGDTKDLEKVDAEMTKIAEELEDLDKDTKVKLGIEGLSTEEIKEKLEKGEIEIPATVDIQLEMSEDIKDMRLLMMQQLGLVSEDEVKLKIGYEIDDALVETLTDDEKEIVVKYIEENEEFWDGLTEDQKEVFIELVASGVDLETLTDDEKKEVVIDFVTNNKNELDRLTEEEKEVVVDLVADDKALQALEDHQVEIEAFARIFGVEEIDDLKAKLDKLNNKQIQVLTEVLGKVKVDELKKAMSNLTDEQVQAIAEAIGKGDVDGLKTAINSLDDEYVQAIAEAFGYSDVNELNKAIDNLDPKTVQAIAQALGITDVDSLKAAIDRLNDKDVQAVANVSGEDDVNSLKGAIENLKGKTITVWASIKKKASNLWSKLTGGGGVDGTAHASGTAFADGTIKKSGRAFKQGDWGTKDSGIALGGEEAPELLVRNGRWHLIGEDGAEFFGYKKGDIIFNGDQTREIFEKGKITHGNGRGKALVSGTAFSSGTGGGIMRDGSSSGGKSTEITTKQTTINANQVNVGGSSGYGGDGSGSNGKSSSKKSSSSSSSSSKDKFEESFDWIERAIQKVERAIDILDKKASRTWKSWSSRNSNLRKEISKIDEEIKLQGDAYDAYMAEANAVGLSSEYKKLVQSGKMDISTITDEETAEKIKKYQEYYDKAKECEDNLLALQDDRMSKYMELFDNVISKYDGIIQGFDHTETMINEYISQAEARGHAVSKNYYKVLMQNEKDSIVSLEKKRQDLIKARDEWVAAGGDVNSEDYFNMCAEIDATTQAIAEGETAILNYANSMREIDWSNFDLLQERISGVTDEANFLIDLMSNDKLYDDNGQLTDQGMATMGLHGQNYNTNMHQADLYAAEIERLNKQIAVDPYDQDLIDRRNELLGLQRESILAAEDEKQAMIDMVKEGIELELDALQERIDKYNEAMDSAKDLYDYQKKVSEQTEEIAKLEKQMAAYAGDDSEEARAKVQELKVSLEEAKENLKETEYEKYISDQKALLDSLYLEYETVLNERLDNTDELLNQMIDSINNKSDAIAETLASEAESVGTTLSEEMQNIWSAGGDESAKSVLTKYGDDFNNNLTTVNTTLGGIKTDIDRMISYLNGEANKDMKSDDTDTSANDDQSGNQNNGDKDKDKNKDKDKDKNKKKTIKKGGKIKATGAKIYDYKGDKSGERQLYRNDPIYKVLAIDGTWIKARYHKLSSGVSGWFKKSDVKAYKTGAKSINYDDMAWTQEGNKREFIVRPSDGAILTPVAKGDSVLNATASSNIWNMANSPVDFIRDNLRLETSNIPSESSTQSSYTQYLDKVVFNLPNVKNYDELLSTMQKDKNFERLINSMTIDQIAGKSSLTKGKSIR